VSLSVCVCVSVCVSQCVCLSVCVSINKDLEELKNTHTETNNIITEIKKYS